MSKGSLILILGFFIAILPSTGFPAPVPSVFSVLFGLAVMALGFLVRQERIWFIRMLEERKKNATQKNTPEGSEA